MAIALAAAARIILLLITTRRVYLKLPRFKVANAELRLNNKTRTNKRERMGKHSPDASNFNKDRMKVIHSQVCVVVEQESTLPVMRRLLQQRRLPP